MQKEKEKQKKKQTMRTTGKILGAIIILLLYIGCKDVKKQPANNINKKTIFYNKGVEFKIDFPDTIYKGKSYNGKIIYRNILDTITTDLDNDINKKNNRYIIFAMARTKNIDYDESYLHKIVKDTFGAIDNNTIPFYDIKFNETGVFYIDGIINDQGYIKLEKKNEKGEEPMRIITNEFRASHKVIVIDNTQ